MKLDIQDIQTASNTDVHIFQIAKMLLASLFLILGLAYLWSNKKTKSIQKPSKPQHQLQDHHPQQTNVPNKLNRLSSTQSYKFSMDQDYNQDYNRVDKMSHIDKRSLNNDSIQNEKVLISLLRDDHQLPYQHVYSIKQARQNFMNLLKQGPKQSLIYLDQKDLDQRQTRKSKIHEKHLIAHQQKVKIKQHQQAAKHKQTKKQQILPKPNVINPPQQEKKPTIGERTLFAVNKDMPKVTEPIKPLDFAQVSLGLSTQVKKEEPQKIQPQHPLQQPFFPVIAPKEQQKPPQFGQGQLSGLSSQQGSSSMVGTNLQQSQSTSLFGQKPAEPKKQQTVNPVQPSMTAPKVAVLPSQLPNTQLPVQTTQPKIQAQQAPSIPSGPVLPPVQQPAQSQPIQQIGSRPSNLTKTDYLQKLIDYGKGAKQHCELKKTKINNFGRSISNLKQIYETALDFINTINLGDAKQVQTLACQIFDFLLTKTIPVWPKQQGWQSFPPRMKNQTMWKISISTYVLKLNLYRVMGHETLWLIVFGKLLSLLDFTWKRTQPIKKSSTAYKELDLVKNTYFSLQKQDDMAPKYFTRLDLITYFLFCMTTFDPQLVGQYLCKQAGKDGATFEQIKKYKYKWSYNYFWILVDSILQNKTKTYFKPVLYMNILSSMYLQIRRNKQNSTEFENFDHLRKFILKQAIEYTAPRALEQNQEIQALADLEEETPDFKFDGEDFLGQLQIFNFYFKEKQAEYKRQGFQQFEKRCSVFNYFKSDSK